MSMPPQNVEIDEGAASEELEALVERALMGERITLTRNGTPTVILEPVRSEQKLASNDARKT